MLDDIVLDEAATLWDELADFEVGKGRAARLHLMRRLGVRLDAHNVGWLGAVRTAIDPNDPLLGWRVGALVYLREDVVNEELVAVMKRRWDRRETEALDRLMISGAGTFRARTLRRAMPEAWFDGEFYRTFYAGRGIFDSLCVHSPVTEDAESFFIFHRDQSAGVFAESEVVFASLVLRGLKWLHRSLMLERGLLVASKPLYPAERRVLGELLTEAKESEIAARLELTPATVHQYVKSIFRKFGVSSRAALMSLWLNRPSPRPSLGD